MTESDRNIFAARLRVCPAEKRILCFPIAHLSSLILRSKSLCCSSSFPHLDTYDLLKVASTPAHTFFVCMHRVIHALRGGRAVSPPGVEDTIQKSRGVPRWKPRCSTSSNRPVPGPLSRYLRSCRDSGYSLRNAPHAYSHRCRYVENLRSKGTHGFICGRERCRFATGCLIYGPVNWALFASFSRRHFVWISSTNMGTSILLVVF